MKTFNQYLTEEPLSDKENLDVGVVVKEWFSDATSRTQIYESTVCIMALKGKSNRQAIESAIKHEDFNPIAKSFYDKFFAEFGSDGDAIKGLSTWVEFLGGPITKLGKMQSFVHNSIDYYYRAAPKTFEVPDASKANTADCVLLVNGSKSSFFSILADLKEKDEQTQIRRIRPFGKLGGVTIVDSNKKGLISFYQVSLKAEGQVGKAGGWVNQNWLGGGSAGSPLQQKAVAQSFDEMLEEGQLLDWTKGKFSKVVASVQAFTSWAAGKLSKLASTISGKGARIANKLLGRNKGIKAIERIFQESGQSLTEAIGGDLLWEKNDPVKLTPMQIENFQIVAKEFVAKDEINALHRKNVAMVSVLNSAFKQVDRDMDPIVMLGDGIIDTKSWKKELTYLASIVYDKKNKVFKVKGKPITHVTRDNLALMFKIASNYGANVAIYGLLKSASNTLGTYKTISQALFAMSGNLEAEIKFGNTALPILICYGGKTQKLVSLGRREDYSKELTDKLVNTAKGMDTDWPVLALRYNKAGTSPQYNVVNMKLLSKFTPQGEKVVPEWLEFGIRTNSGSSFTCTIEASQTTKNWKGR